MEGPGMLINFLIFQVAKHGRNPGRSQKKACIVAEQQKTSATNSIR